MKWIICLLIFMISGCKVGPDFSPPPPPATEEYTSMPMPDQTEEATGQQGSAQKFVLGVELPENWWILFRNEDLDRMIEQALIDSPSIAVAEARLRQALENLTAQKGATLYPQVDLSTGITRERFSTSEIGLSDLGTDSPIPDTITFSLYNASVDVSYLLDIFGGVRRQLEALGAYTEYEKYELEAAQLTLAGNLVTASIQQALLREQIEVTHEIINTAEERLSVVQMQLAAGGTSDQQVASLTADTEQTKATLPPLENRLDQLYHQLAIYQGKTPSEAELTDFTLESFTLPQDLPLSLPSELVRRRPDIRAAEALLHQASAQIGVATANLFPQITLSASSGLVSNVIEDFFDPSSVIWSVGSSLAQPLFHGGELRANQRIAIAAYDEAAANYRQTVLNAFQNVADALKALESDAKTLKADAQVAEQAKLSFEIVKRQYQLGGASYLELLDAQRTYQETKLALAESRAARLSDTAALLQALGGGWENEDNLDSSTEVSGN